jgi:signal transduction histidine kinase
MENKFINKITNTNFIIVSLIAIPLNLLIYFALKESEYQFIRAFPPLFGVIAVLLALFRNRISFFHKTWTFILLLFLTGCFNLLLGLLDLASLWFILAIIFTLFISKKNEALVIFIISFFCITVTGFLMIAQNTFIPLKYNFENCHFTCVAVRIVHFLLIGFSVYYILHNFFSKIKSNVVEFENKNLILENLNISIEKEMNEKKELQDQMLETVILTEEKERKRIASDLHDGLGPVLSAVNLFFQAYIDAPKGAERNNIETKLKVIINDAIADVSRISHNISPHILESYGLTTALKTFIDQLNNSEKIKIELHIDHFNRFELKYELTIYRTITELINNTIKHANADRIEIRFEQTVNTLKIKYKDDGRGFSNLKTHKDSAGMGIQNIKNRILSLGGSITFSNSENGGMTASIVVPYIEIARNEAY